MIHFRSMSHNFFTKLKTLIEICNCEVDRVHLPDPGLNVYIIIKRDEHIP